MTRSGIPSEFNIFRCVVVRSVDGESESHLSRDEPAEEKDDERDVANGTEIEVSKQLGELSTNVSTSLFGLPRM